MAKQLHKRFSTKEEKTLSFALLPTLRPESQK